MAVMKVSSWVGL
jgi:hypothetical protein